MARGKHWPLFDGLERARLSVGDIATIVGVSTKAVRNWSQGRTRVPPAVLALLTLVLENALQETERLHIGYGATPPNWRKQVDDRLEPIRRCLRAQYARNATLPAEALLQARRLFHGGSSRMGKSGHTAVA